jgi:hypothetical protein
VDSFAVLQRDDAKHTRFAIAPILNLDPMANASIPLRLTPQRPHKCSSAPRALSIRAFTNDLFLEISRRLHLHPVRQRFDRVPDQDLTAKFGSDQGTIGTASPDGPQRSGPSG